MGRPMVTRLVAAGHDVHALAVVRRIAAELGGNLGVLDDVIDAGVKV
jgi:3-hydroxyisobutyrate dehydrogenase-like beta-hydroxyacid dehydrogenase